MNQLNKQYNSEELYDLLRDNSDLCYESFLTILKTQLIGQAKEDYERCWDEVVHLAQTKGETHAVFIIPRYHLGISFLPCKYDFMTLLYPVGSQDVIDNAVRKACGGEFLRTSFVIRA